MSMIHHHLTSSSSASRCRQQTEWLLGCTCYVHLAPCFYFLGYGSAASAPASALYESVAEYLRWWWWWWVPQTQVVRPTRSCMHGWQANSECNYCLREFLYISAGADDDGPLFPPSTKFTENCHFPHFLLHSWTFCVWITCWGSQSY